jgi:hypothetical protein
MCVLCASVCFSLSLSLSLCARACERGGLACVQNETDGRAVVASQVQQQMDGSLADVVQDRNRGPVSLFNYVTPCAHHPLSIGLPPQ